MHSLLVLCLCAHLCLKGLYGTSGLVRTTIQEIYLDGLRRISHFLGKNQGFYRHKSDILATVKISFNITRQGFC